MTNEPEIIINGVQLHSAQAMMLRVALSGPHIDWYCGDDEHGLTMTKLYKQRAREVLAIMFKVKENEL